VTKLLGDIKRLQQLGIIRLDTGARQLVGGKIVDFSQAITVPHFVTTPELNPYLTPKMLAAMEYETFQHSRNDYLFFDEMMCQWNYDYAKEKGAMDIYAIYGRKISTSSQRYELRKRAAQERAFTYVDPRRYDWHKRTNKRLRLRKTPPMWIYYCGDKPALANRVREYTELMPLASWTYRHGVIHPVLRESKNLTQAYHDLAKAAHESN